MKFIFGMIGLILGAAMGSVFGALIGLALGIGLAYLVQSNQVDSSSANTTGQPLYDDHLSPERLGQRVARLEKEIAALRTVLKSWTSSGSATPVAPSTAAVPASAAQRAATPSAHMVVPAAPEIDTSALLNPLSVKPTEPEVVDFSATWPAELSYVMLPTAPPVVLPAAPPAVPSAPVEPIAASAGSVAPATVPVPPPAARPAPAPQPEQTFKESLPPFVQNLIFGGNTIVKIGVLILFLGLAFLLRYAAERVTVPVELYYAGVALLGAVLLVLGWHLHRRGRERKDASGEGGYGLVLQGAGIGVLYLTTLAALKLNQLLPAELAFGFLFVVAVLSALLAVVQNAPWLAYVAAAEGFAAPVLVSTGSGNHIALFSYLAILDIGIFLVAWFRAWRPLNLIGFIGTTLLAGAWAHSSYTDVHYASAQGFLVFFFVLFTFVGVLFARRALALGDTPDVDEPIGSRAAKALSSVGRVDSALVFGVPLTCFGLQYGLVQGNEFGPAWAAMAFALFYLLLGGGLMRGGNVRYSLLGEAYAIVGVIFGTLAIPLALEGAWTGATWAIEAAGMYWLGVRQRRTYTRAFALLVLGGATVRLVTALGLDLAPNVPLLVGSVLSMLMLSVSGLVMYVTGYRAARSADAAPRGEWEAAAAALHLWVGLGALASVAWLILVPQWACVATSLLALVCALLSGRVRTAALHTACVVLHAIAVAGWVSTLHQVPGQAMLSNGWQGLVVAVLIGLSLVASVLLPLLAALRAAKERQQAPVWSVASHVGLLAGLALLSLSFLFVMPAEDAARIWPWLGLAALWLGLRLGHPALGVGWGALQLGAGFAFLTYGPSLWADHSAVLTAWTPLGLTLAALVSGDWIQRAAKEPAKGAQFGGLVGQWLVVAWSLAWWTAVLLPDVHRYLLELHLTSHTVWLQVLAGWIVLTSVLVAGVARWRDWRVLGQTTWVTVPVWALLAWFIGTSSAQPIHAYAGWVVWPAALVWHAVLLRMQPRWLSHPQIAPLHAVGFLVFVFLAALEVHWCLAFLGDAGTVWPMLGAVLVPAAAVVLVSRPQRLQRWPMNEFAHAYVKWACAPVALYLLWWLWGSNANSGTAAPLPYIPLLNPLEIGHGFALLALVLWGRARWQSLNTPLLLAVLGATAFALYSGMVLRACHHFAGVPWNDAALYGSTLAQAALSVAWSLLGVVLMLLGAKRVRRGVWVAGAGLLGVVVLKLFFVELADTGGVYRIVSFMVVGLLLLVVGYFAPVPPAEKKTAAPKEVAHESA
jgi:uncharacterized membrane protein